MPTARPTTARRRRAGATISASVAGAGAALALGAAASDADATWSIVLCDVRTGEVVAASATCLTSFDLRAGTPVVIAGLGAATAQSSVDANAINRTRIRDGFLDGRTLDEILDQLSVLDGSHQSRQYGMATVDGQTLTFSGANANEWKGGVTGRYGDVVYAIQGNILTGAPVVLEAEQRIRDHLRVSQLDGTYDLPGATLAGMEGARALGGDGRCSCTTANPTGCGTPPPEPFKSADIGYVIVARDGDLDRCTATYPGLSSADAGAVGDVTGDGVPDIVSTRSTGDFAVSQVLPPNPDALLDVTRFGPASPPMPAGTYLRAVAVADVTGDGLADVLGPSNTTGGLVVIESLGDGDFAPPISYGQGNANSNRGRTIALADFDGVNGLDAAVVDGRGENIRVFLNNGDGTFAEGANAFNDRRFRGIGAGDFDNDGIADIVAASDVTDTVVILSGNGDGTFGVLRDDPVAGEPEFVSVADFTGDGIADIAVGATLASGVTLYTGGQGAVTKSTLPTDDRVIGVYGADLNDDGDTDLVARLGQGRVVVFPGTPSGIETTARDAGAADTTSTVVFADFGRGTQGVSVRSAVLTVLDNTTELGIDASRGCGEGDYYISLNVAFANRGDEDPVFQLQDQFDAQRDALVGVPDAVRTLVQTPGAAVPAGRELVFTVRPRDWAGTDLPFGTVQSLGVEASPGSAVVPTDIEIVPVADGRFDITVDTDTAARGRLDLRITAQLASGDTLVLMQPAAVEVRSMIADFNGDGAANLLDVIEFITRWSEGNPLTDLNGSGGADVQDVVLFLELFQGT